MSNFVIQYSSDGGKTWWQTDVLNNIIRIGRADDNDLKFDDHQISRHHAQLRLEQGQVWILDQNSGNGIYVNSNLIPANQWLALPAGAEVVIGAVILRASAQPVAMPAAPRPAQPRRAAPKPQKKGGWSYILIGVGIVFICACLLAVGGGALWYFYPQLTANISSTQAAQNQPEGATASPGNVATLAPTFAPPVALESLPAAPGNRVQDEHGVALNLPPDSLESGQQVALERLQLGSDMVATIGQAYDVQSLAYNVAVQGDQDAIGRAQLSLPAPSPDSQLAVLVADRWLGVLDVPAENGVFQINPFMNLAADAATYPMPEGSASLPNRYLVVTPKEGASRLPDAAAKLARQMPDNADGRSCVAETWTLNHCWRNNEKSVYVFWEDNYPASLSSREYLVVIETIRVVAGIMQTYQQRGFTAAAIGPSNPVYIIIEAGAGEPYYSFKTGNIYIPWDIIAGIGDTANRCTMSHELFHWIEDEEYRMGIAALTPSKSWWLETSAENGSFMQDSACIEKSLAQYGLVTTDNNILGFQSAPQQWTIGSEQARYIHGLQLYVSLCEGGVGCALSQASWAEAINEGTYPFDGAALAAYESNSKDMGRYLLGAAPQQSRANAVIPPSALSGSGFGDYVILKTGGKSSFDYGMTTSQFQGDDKKVDVTARLERGGVYPLWVGNGTGSPTGRQPGYTGLPGMLEIEAGPAFWLKQDDQEPVFYPVGSKLLLGPISDQMGIGTARIVAVERDQERTFKARLSLIDLAGDFFSESSGNIQTDVISCPNYEGSNEEGMPAILGYFALYGVYVQDSADTQQIHYTWQGALPEGLVGDSEVTVTPENVKLNFTIEIPRPTSRFLLPGELQASIPAPHINPAVAWLPLLGVVGLGTNLRRRGKILLAILAVLASLLLLSSCITIWGTISGEFVMDQLEYVGPDSGVTLTNEFAAVGLTPNWKFANSSFDIRFDLVMLVANPETEETYEDVCQVNFTGNADMFVFPDGVLTEEMINRGEDAEER